MLINLKKYVYALNWFYRIPIESIDLEFWNKIVPNDLEEENNV